MRRAEAQELEDALLRDDAADEEMIRTMIGTLRRPISLHLVDERGEAETARVHGDEGHGRDEFAEKGRRPGRIRASASTTDRPEIGEQIEDGQDDGGVAGALEVATRRLVEQEVVLRPRMLQRHADVCAGQRRAARGR